MKNAALPLLAILAACAGATGCAGGRVVSMGNDTYMVERGGWPHMNEFALETKCLDPSSTVKPVLETKIC